MGLGGPVWHASAAPARYAAAREYLRDRAYEALAGVGAIALGQWEEWTGRAFHVRRRLSTEEIRLGGIGEVIDVRGTWEGRKRIERVRQWAPPQLWPLIEDEASRPA